MDYRKCFIPTCKNDTNNSPDKVLVRIREDLRETWCHQANVPYFKDYKQYCCEDHFDPRVDLRNYYQHMLMKDEPRLKPKVKLRIITQPTENTELTRQSQYTSRLCELLLQGTSTRIPIKRKHEDISHIPTTFSYSTVPTKIDVSTQCEVKMLHKSTNYMIQKQISYEAIAEGDSTLNTSASTNSRSLLICTSKRESIDCQSKQQLEGRNIILDLIYKKPKLYLGLPKDYVWLIDHIVKTSTVKVNSLCLIITLFKIKLNDSVERLSDQFQVSQATLSTMIFTGIEILVNYLQNFIFCPTAEQIKANLPLVFKIGYSNVEMIIDSFEIQICKPSSPQIQAQTWSQCKGCNTVKYLIGFTPNGFVSFISKGYGGQISDKDLVEQSELVSVLNKNAVILADRGFKEIESLLHDIKLFRTQSVYSAIKHTTSEALQSNVVTSLRVHVEKVVGQIREFCFLKPHSTVNYEYVPYLDEIVVIACGLINLQGEIIKTLKYKRF